MLKPAYQNTTSEAFWDIPIYAEHNEVRANRIDARLVSHERKEVCTIEMSSPWIESRAKKDEEKTLKYGPMVLGLKQRYNGYGVEQYNVIIDGFLHGRIPQRIPLLEYKSFTNNCYLPRFATTGKQNPKSLMKNAAHAAIPWRMCSTFYLAVVEWHRLSTYRDITMLSRSYSLKSFDL